jgi:hypothetical protein
MLDQVSDTTTAKVCPVTGASAVADLSDRSQSEWVVATAVRCRLAGYEFGDIACWELCSDLLEQRLGAYGPLVEAELSGFVRKLRRLMDRPFEYHPHPTRALASDEALLLDLIAQAGRGGDARALAGRLCPDPDALAALAATTAARLAKAGIKLG